AGADQIQNGGQHRQRDGGRDQRDRQAGVAHRPDRQQREEQQSRQRDGDGGGGEGDGATGRAHGGRDRGAGVGARDQFVAEPVDHQQAVVDRQPQPEQGGDIGRGGGQIGDHGDQPQRAHGDHHRDHGDHQRQTRRDQAAEDEQQRDQGDREGDGFAHHHVFFTLLHGFAQQHGVTTDADLDRAVRALEAVGDIADPAVHFGFLAEDAGHDQALAAVGAAQGG